MNFKSFDSLSTEKNTYGFGRKKPFEFALKKSESREIVFIDDTPFCTREHSLFIDGAYKSYQCIGDNCPLCQSGHSSAAVYYLTVVDLKPWTDRTGETHHESFALFKFKQKAALELKKIKEKHGRLKGLKIEAKREDTQYAGKSGNRFFYVEDASNYLEEYSEIEYLEVFKKPSRDELYQVANKVAA